MRSSIFNENIRVTIFIKKRNKVKYLTGEIISDLQEGKDSSTLAILGYFTHLFNVIDNFNT